MCLRRVSGYPFGKLSDTVSHGKLLAAGLVVLIASDLVLASASSWVGLSLGAALWGVCTAVVAQPALVASIPSDDLRALLRREAEFAMQWLAIVSRQLRQARTRVERLCLKGARERVRHLLLTEGSGAAHRYTLHGSVKDLAVELGLSHEALCKPSTGSYQGRRMVSRSTMSVTAPSRPRRTASFSSTRPSSSRPPEASTGTEMSARPCTRPTGR